MSSPEVSLRHQLFGVWCGPIFSVLTVVGWLGIAHFWAPAPADLSAADMAEFFTRAHREGVLLGSSIFLFACCFLVITSVQLGLVLAKIEGPAPLWSIVEVLGGTGIAIVVILDCSFWISAAYRPAAHPDVVVAMNDAAWLGFLLGWPLLSLQMVATAIVALDDRRGTFPRWVSKASIAGAIALVTAAGPAFTHSGLFAYHGLLGFYVPMLIWGAWLNAHAWYMRRAILRERSGGGTLGLAA